MEFYITFVWSLFLIALIVHMFGIYFLIKHSKFISSNQKLYLVSLISSDVLLATHHVVWEFVLLRKPRLLSSSVYIITDIVHYDCIWIINLLTLIFLTLDRFAEVYWTLKYPLYFTRKRTFYLIKIIWTIGIVLSVIMTCLYYLKKINYPTVTFMYIYTILDTSAVLIAIPVYYYIYRTCVKNRQKLPGTPKELKRNNTFIQDGPRNVLRKAHVRKWKLFIPALIMTTFTIFIYIPDMTRFIKVYLLKEDVPWLVKSSKMMYSFNMISDAGIYIFMQRGVRQIISKKFEAGKNIFLLRQL